MKLSIYYSLPQAIPYQDPILTHTLATTYKVPEVWNSDGHQSSQPH